MTVRINGIALRSCQHTGLFRLMSDDNPIEAAAQRLKTAISALDVAAKRSKLTDDTVDSLQRELQALSEDRSRLAQELDALKNRNVELERATKDVSGRVDGAIAALEETIKEAEQG